MTSYRQLDWVAVWGRVFLSFIFIISGLSKIPNWESTVQYMTSQGMPVAPLFLFPAIFIEVVGGFAILLGWKARAAALVLALYLIPVTLVFHGFWALTGMDRQVQMINFMKNLAIIGGLFIVSAFGSGAISLDHLLERKHKSGGTKTDRPLLKSAS